MNAGTFEAAPWGNCNLFSRRQTLLNRVWNSSEGITFKNSYEPGMKMRLIIFQLIHSSVKCVFDLISLLTGQIWLQMTFGCFMKKKNKKKKTLLSGDENLRPRMIFKKNKAQISKATHRQNCQLLPIWRISLWIEPNSGWTGTFVLDVAVKYQPLSR